MRLTDPIYTLPLLNEKQINGFSKLNIFTLSDLIQYYPKTYLDTRNVTKFYNWNDYECHTTEVQVISNKIFRTKFGKFIVTVILTDGINEVEAMYFNQPFMAKVFEPNQYYLIYGKINKYGHSRNSILISEYEKLIDGKGARHLAQITPIYKETKGVSSKLIRSKVSYIFSKSETNFEENLPAKFVDKFDLLDRNLAIKNIHFPASVELLDKAKERFAHEEIYNLYIEMKKIDSERYKVPSIPITPKIEDKSKIPNEFILNNIHKYLNFEFQPSQSQIEVINEIITDLQNRKPMNRLLQGDVGSGKTFVSAVASLFVLLSERDVVLLCPTTVLSAQHSNSFRNFFKNNDVEIIEVTAKTKKLPLSNKPKIFIGTHSILFKKPEIFRNVALCIVDEQHRFGVEQREQLIFDIRSFNKNQFTPHLLIMTATPIPRTMAQFLLSDLSLSYMKNSLRDRLPIKTWVIPENKRIDSYEWIIKRLNEKEQIYIICPLIEESEKLGLKNVLKVYEEVCDYFKNFKVGLLHGKLKVNEKNNVLDSFRKNEINILVSTQVIEVGLDVQNATVMVIESAEKFGLAGLHQLRGRVGRGKLQSYCLVYPTPGIDNPEAIDRLNYFARHNDGMELSEFDMKNRGFGNIVGNEQSGIMKFKFVDINNLGLIKHVKKVLDEI